MEMTQVCGSTVLLQSLVMVYRTLQGLHRHWEEPRTLRAWGANT